MSVNMNDKSKVKNLCPFPISWVRITQIGDEYIKANSSMPILNSEIDAQVSNGNVYLGGIDRLGSHAMVYIENDEFREELKFDNKSENKKQNILDEDKCKYILELKTISAFKKNIAETIITIHEKMKIMEVARKVKLNDFDKITFLEEYCGAKFKE